MSNVRTKMAPEKLSLEAMRERDAKLVKGVFRYHEAPGAELKFVYRGYKGEHPVKYVLRDAEIYSIPLGVARHINKNLWYPVHQWAVDERGAPIATVGQKIQRASFNSLEFLDSEDLSPASAGIVSVEYQK